MGKYVLAYRGGGMPDTPEEGEKVMAAWGVWMGALGPSLVDVGNPFGPAKSIGSNGAVTDGGSAALTGYSVISADDLGSATEKAKGCPVLMSGGSVDVYETYDVM
jgi:hypothetical protein